MLPDHVHHLEVAFEVRLVVLEELHRIILVSDIASGVVVNMRTSGQGICLAGRGPLPVHLCGPPVPPPFR